MIILFSVLSGVSLCAEGTKQVAPTSTDVTALYTNNTTYGSFASYGGPSDTRLNIHIADPANEQVYFGFSQRMSTSNGSDGSFLNSTYYFRIKDPSGNVVFGPETINTTTVNANSWSLASSGPSPIVGGSGYTPFTYVPAAGAASGDYYIEFSRFSNFSSNGTSNLSIKYWDITVATRTSPTEIDGRVWSEKWAYGRCAYY